MKNDESKLVNFKNLAADLAPVLAFFKWLCSGVGVILEGAVRTELNHLILLFQVSVSGLPTSHPVGKPITFTVDASQAGEGAAFESH